MALIRFRYRDAQGNESERELLQWSETTTYIQGRTASDTFPNTFRKDRVIAFLQGQALMLNEAALSTPHINAYDVAASVALTDTRTPRLTVGGQNQILFTGFSSAERAELEQQATGLGMRVMKTPGKALTFLCYGFNAGPSKVAKAQDAGAFIINSAQFQDLARTGELSGECV